MAGDGGRPWLVPRTGIEPVRPVGGGGF